MHQFSWARLALAPLFVLLLSSASQAQYGDLGVAEQPSDTEPIAALIDYGEYNDMSGGYQIGDTAFNFTVYDFDGNPVKLYEELAGPKPVVMVSGSTTCPRFRDNFDLANTTQSVLATRNFLFTHQDDFNWIFIYGIEAHPTEGDCPSNCPPNVYTDTTVVQAGIYAERRWSMHTWLNSPEHDMPFNMYADNPDNAVYNAFFRRPFGMVALNCDGTVALRADWLNAYLFDPANVQELLNFKENHEACEIEWTPDEEVSSTVLEAATSNFKVYPNPACSWLTTEIDTPETAWELTDMQGRTVASWTQNQFRSSVPVAHLPRGNYLLIGRSDETETQRRRVILH